MSEQRSEPQSIAVKIIEISDSLTKPMSNEDRSHDHGYRLALQHMQSGVYQLPAHKQLYQAARALVDLPPAIDDVAGTKTCQICGGQAITCAYRPPFPHTEECPCVWAAEYLAALEEQ